MAKKSKVIVKDRGYAKRTAAIHRMAKTPIDLTIGVHAEEGAASEDGGPTVAAIASIHEFGEGNQEQRSWLGAYVDENGDAIRGRIKKVAEAAAAGKVELERGLGVVGELAVDGIIARIRARIDPPNAESTIAAKGSDVPLIDDSQFVGSITYKVGAAP